MLWKHLLDILKHDPAGDECGAGSRPDSLRMATEPAGAKKKEPEQAGLVPAASVFMWLLDSP